MRIRQIFFFVLISLVTTAASAQLPPEWSTQFTNLGIVGKVFALLPAHDSLYIGGTFDAVAGIPAANVALWDGKAWHALGSGTNKGVYSLAFDADHTVLVGGEFNTAGGQTANSIARWNGTAWSAMGTGVIPPPTSKQTVRRGVLAILVTSTNDVYIGGCIDRNGDGDRINDIAHWNGTRWDSLQFGLASHGNSLGAREPGVIALVETPWGIAAGGSFVAANFKLGSGVAFWKDGAWSAPLVDESAQVYVKSMFFAQGSLVFAGDLASKWPGSPFVAYNGPGPIAGPPDFPGFPVSLIAPISTTLFAAQTDPCDTCHVHNLSSFDAGIWSPVGAGIDSTANVMVATKTRLYLAGNFSHANGKPSDGIAMYDMFPAAVALHRAGASRPLSIITRSGLVRVEGSPKNIAVFDEVGREIYGDRAAISTQNQDETEINLSSLSNGLYLIANGDQIIKVLLQR